jgi:hypothetical protein
LLDAWSILAKRRIVLPMDPEERRQLQDYVDGLLAGWDVQGEARVQERPMACDSGRVEADHREIVEVRLPEAAMARGGTFATRMGCFISNYLRGNRRRKTVTICHADGKLIGQVEIGEMPET